MDVFLIILNFSLSSALIRLYKYRVDNKKVFHKSDEKMHTKSILHVQQHHDESFLTGTKCVQNLLRESTLTVICKNNNAENAK